MLKIFQQLLLNPPYHMVFVSLISLVLYLFIISFFRFVYPKKRIPYPLLLLGFSLLPIISIFREGTYESSDINIHIVRTMAFYKSLAEGVLIPRWAGELNATYGYPLFNYYYPLPYYISSFYHYLGFNFLDSVKILLITTYLSSGLAMFYWLKNKVTEKYAFLGSVFYLFAPYHLVDMHFRAAVGEMTAFVFLPLSFFFIDKIIEKGSFLWIFLTGISIALLILSHPAIALVGFFGIISYCILLLSTSRKNIILKVLAGILTGLLFSAFYWLPANLEAKYVYQQIGELVLKYQSLSELLYSKWRQGLLFQGPMGEQSYLLGYSHWIVIFLSFYLIFIKRNKDKFLIFFSIITTILIFLTLDIGKFVWNYLPILKKMLITSRLLVIIAFTSSAVAAFTAKSIKKEKLFYFLIIIAIGSTILNWGNRKNIQDKKDQQIVYSMTAKDEGAYNAIPVTRPLDMLWLDPVPKTHIEAINGKLDILSETRTTIKHRYTVNTESDGLVKENTYYFPGWKLKINGKETDIIFDNKNFPGIIVFNTRAGINQIDLTFEDTGIRKFSVFISLLSLLISGLFLFLNSFKRIFTFWQQRQAGSHI